MLEPFAIFVHCEDSPYVKRSKTDAADAEAICETVTRPTIRFVPVKSPEDQLAAVVLKTRELFVRQRSQTANAIRAHMAEFGIIAATGMTRIAKLTAILRDDEDCRLPPSAGAALLEMAEQIVRLTDRINDGDRKGCQLTVIAEGFGGIDAADIGDQGGEGSGGHGKSP